MTSLAASLQRRLSDFYGIDEGPTVDDFVRVIDDGRERLLVRVSDDGVELSLELPAESVSPTRPMCLDRLGQIVEGVSHFVLVAERARCELPTTQLELELQAEIDKFIIIAGLDEELCADRARACAARLFGPVEFIHPEGTEMGDRYRMAHRLAGRVAHRLTVRLRSQPKLRDVRAELRQFYQLGQAAKIVWARAA